MRFLFKTYTSSSQWILSSVRVFSAIKVNEARFQWGRDLETAGANGTAPYVSLASIATYGENYDRLAAAKATYDAANAFRVNQNIRPSEDQASVS